MSDFITIRYTLTGSLASYGPAIEDAAAAIVAEHTADLAAAIIASFADDKSGRLYTRDDGAVYQASAPGEAPAVKDGDLRASVQVVPLSALAQAVIVTDPKAPILEYGLGSIAARPFVTPAAEAARAAFISDMANLEDRLGRR